VDMSRWSTQRHGDDDQGDEEPGPVASSTRHCGGAGREACYAFRSVVSVLVRFVSSRVIL
jgi:hypothetical protein